jgi:OmpA-OmpF porin, OOP family
MLKHRLLLAAGALAAFLALPLTAAAQASLYAGGSLGQAHYNEACNNLLNCDDRDTGFSFFAGWQFNRFIAMEAAYRDFGHLSSDEANVKANALELDAVGTLHLYRGFSLLGRIGAFRGNMKAGSSERNHNVTFGWGGQYDFSPGFAMRGEWQRYRKMGGGDFGTKIDIDALSLAMLFRF